MGGIGKKGERKEDIDRKGERIRECKGERGEGDRRGERYWQGGREE